MTSCGYGGASPPQPPTLPGGVGRRCNDPQRAGAPCLAEAEACPVEFRSSDTPQAPATLERPGTEKPGPGRKLEEERNEGPRREGISPQLKLVQEMYQGSLKGRRTTADD